MPQPLMLKKQKLTGWFYEDLQDLLELTPKTNKQTNKQTNIPFFIIED